MDLLCTHKHTCKCPLSSFPLLNSRNNWFGLALPFKPLIYKYISDQITCMSEQYLNPGIKFNFTTFKLLTCINTVGGVSTLCSNFTQLHSPRYRVPSMHTPIICWPPEFLIQSSSDKTLFLDVFRLYWSQCSGPII